MKYIELYKLEADGTQIICAICRLEGGTHEVRCEGDEVLVGNLTSGIPDPRDSRHSKSVTPSDGELFLEGLSHLSSGYFEASSVKESPDSNLDAIRSTIGHRK